MWGTSCPTQARERSLPWTIVVLLLKCMFSNSVMLLHFSVSPFLLSRRRGICVIELIYGYGSVRTKWPQGRWVGPCAAGHHRIEVIQRRPNTEFHYTDPWDDLDSTMVLFYKGVGLNSDFTLCYDKQETNARVGTNLTVMTRYIYTLWCQKFNIRSARTFLLLVVILSFYS